MVNEFGISYDLSMMPNCVFNANAGGGTDRQDYTIRGVPPEVLNRLTTTELFRSGKKIYGTPHNWEYYIPSKPSGLKDGVIVARDPRNSLNRVVGTEKFVSICFAAYEILDETYPGHPFRNMDLIESRTYNSTSTVYNTKTRGSYWTTELLQIPDLSIDQMKEKYSVAARWDETQPFVGIQYDMPHPAFFLYSADSWEDSFTTKSVKVASALVHDWGHHEMFMAGYKFTGPEAEVLCLTNQMEFIREVVARYYSSVYRNRISINHETASDLSGYLHKLNIYLQENISGDLGHLLLVKNLWGYTYAPKAPDDLLPDFSPFIL
jgi:hypothetical protein